MARVSAYYTPEYAKRVAVAMFEEMTPELLQREMEGRTVLLKQFGEGMRCVCHELRDHGCQFQCGSCYHRNGAGKGTPKTQKRDVAVEGNQEGDQQGDAFVHGQLMEEKTPKPSNGSCTPRDMGAFATCYMLWKRGGPVNKFWG